MSKEVPYKLEAICDTCGHKGAFDFYGDYRCHDCLEFEEDEDEVGEFDED